MYTDSSGAEICVPWVIAATPPQLNDVSTCAPMHGMDQGGHTVAVSDSNPEGTHATEAGCCSQCAALGDRCNVWVHQPSNNSCWLLYAPDGTPTVPKVPRSDRTLGFHSGNASLPGDMTAGTYEYGLLWNMPNFGQQILNDNTTVFSAHDPVNEQIDFWVTTRAANTAGHMAAAQSILHNFVDAVGHAPILPEWASGYWHSPMGHPDYNQSTATAAAEGLHARGLKTGG